MSPPSPNFQIVQNLWPSSDFWVIKVLEKSLSKAAERMIRGVGDYRQEIMVIAQVRNGKGLNQVRKYRSKSKFQEKYNESIWDMINSSVCRSSK